MQSNDQELIYSVSVGRSDKVISLLKYGANPNSANDSGESVLHLACRIGHHDIIENLLMAGADVTCLDKLKRTPLHIASYAGHEKIMLRLIESGAMLDAQCAIGWTPLHATVIPGNCRAARLLIEHRANLNVVDDQGHTALHLACFVGNQLMAALLLESGSDVSVQTHNENLTPNHIASERGHIGILALFSERGLDMNVINVNLETPLHTACLYNQVESVRFLISVKVDLEGNSKYFGTPYQIALRLKRSEIVQILAEAGAKQNVSDANLIENQPKVEEKHDVRFSLATRSHSHRLLRPPKIDWKSEKIPEKLEHDYSELVDIWRTTEERSLKVKCCAILNVYIQGWGWRNHRELCQSIYDELKNVEDFPEKLYQFFNDQLKHYHFDYRFRQDGGFVRALLFCRYAIVKEQTQPSKSTPLYSSEIFCILM